jgi:hypothetical protein
MTASRVGTEVQGMAGAAWGFAVLAGGRRLWVEVTGRPPTTIERAGIAVLGGRQLAQGLAQAGAPDRLRRTWVAVDLAHAVSMVLLARNRTLRRPALLSAGFAGTSAAVSLLLGRVR